jgi:hypothetical protein
LIASVGLNWFRYRVPEFSGCKVFDILLPGGSRALVRVLVFDSGEEMLGEVVLRMIGFFAGAHAQGYSDGRNRENEEAEERDGK